MAMAMKRWWWMYEILILIIFIYPTNSWNINLQPKQVVNAESLGQSFQGKIAHQHGGESFKLVETDGESLLIGGRNVVYNLTINGLILQKALEWSPIPQDMDICKMKGKSQEECENYIRLLIKQTNGRILICGTNAYKPMCRQYAINEDDDYQIQREFSGFAISPYDPRHNSTAFYVSETDELYTGTVSDFTGSDPLIYRKPLMAGMRNELRTQRNNMKCLNDPNFISVMDDDEAVYFFFRETALEYANCGSSNGGKATYARVGRVCKNDQGGTRTYSDTWTSFTKARLNCSMPGTIPFYFDELQSTTILTKNAQNNGMIYAIFTTPYNGLQASAVCAFRLADVKRILIESAFKTQNSPTSMWGPIGLNEAPSPRPGICGGNSQSLTDDVLKFIQKNSLVDESIPMAFNEPLFVHSDLKSRFTQIAVHSNVISVDRNEKYDVIFVGTDDGRIFKFVNVQRKNEKSVRTILIETIKIFEDDRAINNLLVHDGKDARLIVVSSNEIKSLPLYNCQNRTSCGACVKLQDPYCAWNILSQQCVGRSNGYWSDGQYKQSISDGQMKDCDGGDPNEKVLFTFNDLSAQPISNEKPLIYGSEINMAVAVIITLTIAATLGFFVGYRFSRWRTSNLSTEYASSSTSSASGNCYVGTATKHLNENARTIDVYGGGSDEVAVAPVLKFGKVEHDEATNLVLAFPRDERPLPTIPRGKEENERFLNNGMSTNAKVKKMYV